LLPLAEITPASDAIIFPSCRRRLMPDDAAIYASEFTLLAGRAAYARLPP